MTDVFFSDPETKKRRSEENLEKSQFFFNRQYVLWICKDLLPYNLAESEAFRSFWKWMQSYSKLPFELPSRGTVSLSALNDVYICFKDKLIQTLAVAPEHATMTMDGWCDKHKRTAYMTFTYHYMNDDWKICTAVLKTEMFDHPHKAERIQSVLQATFLEYKLLSKKITVVTDNGRNMIAASRLLNLRRLPCIGHGMHLLIMTDLLDEKKVHLTGMQPILNILKKIRAIHFKLIYKNDELKTMWNTDHHEKLMKIIEEYRETGTIYWSIHNYTIFLFGMLKLCTVSTIHYFKSSEQILNAEENILLAGDDTDFENLELDTSYPQGVMQY